MDKRMTGLGKRMGGIQKTPKASSFSDISKPISGHKRPFSAPQKNISTPISNKTKKTTPLSFGLILVLLFIIYFVGALFYIGVICRLPIWRCESCKGSGEEVCDRCYGKGKVECHAAGSTWMDGRHVVECSNCSGRGYNGPKICGKCMGKGWFDEACPECNGTGIHDCHHCGGDGKCECTRCHGRGRKGKYD